MKKIISIVLLLIFLIMPLSSVKATSPTAKRLHGRLLLGVEQKGAIWFVDNKEYKRHQITWDNALPIFQQYALGITNSDLLKIPANLESIRPELDTDGDGYKDRTELKYGYNPFSDKGRFKTDKNFANRLKNKFLLQVNQGGAIWYVDNNGIRHNVRWNNLMPLFRKLALGITNEDLEEIEENNVNESDDNISKENCIQLLLTLDEMKQIFIDSGATQDEVDDLIVSEEYLGGEKDNNLTALKFIEISDKENKDGTVACVRIFNFKSVKDSFPFFNGFVFFTNQIEAKKFFDVQKEKGVLGAASKGNEESIDGLGEEAIKVDSFVFSGLLFRHKNIVGELTTYADDKLIKSIIQKQQEKINGLGL